MGRRLCGLCATAVLGWAAAPAPAAPVALLDAPRAHDVAIAGEEIVIARTTARSGIRVDAVPVTGGATRRLLALRSPGPDADSAVQVAAAPGVIAALVVFAEVAGRPEFRLYTGPPGGPLQLRARVRDSARSWLPYALAADADRVLLDELRFRPFATRARVFVPGGAPEPVPWSGALLAPSALSGDRVAFVGSIRRGDDARIDHMYVVDRHTGAVEASAKLRRDEDVEDDDLDLTPDGRAVAAADGRLITVAPGVAPVRLEGGFTAPRFSGDGIAALKAGRFDARTPLLLPPGAAPRALGSPSAAIRAFEADDRGAAWIANGCVLYAPRDGAPPAEPPAGPCPRAEVVHEEGDQVLRGRRLRVRVTCIAAPSAGCRGTALLGRRGENGRGAFRVPAGMRRTVAVRLTDRGMRRVRRARRHHDFAILELSARVHDGRAHGTSAVVVDRLRP